MGRKKHRNYFRKAIKSRMSHERQRVKNYLRQGDYDKATQPALIFAYTDMTIYPNFIE